jgi:hypothetical protein
MPTVGVNAAMDSAPKAERPAAGGPYGVHTRAALGLSGRCCC